MMRIPLTPALARGKSCKCKRGTLPRSIGKLGLLPRMGSICATVRWRVHGAALGWRPFMKIRSFGLLAALLLACNGSSNPEPADAGAPDQGFVRDESFSLARRRLGAEFSTEVHRVL